jgi:hypothetical protein
MKLIKPLEQIQEVLNNHSQINANSCVPMSIELALKLMGKVNYDYFDLQNEDPLRKNFKLFDNCKISGVKFSHHYNYNRDDKFPIDNLIEDIKSEIDNDKFVICAYGSNNLYHGYVIYGYDENELFAITKYHEGPSEFYPEFINDMTTRLKKINGSDILKVIS